MGPQNPGGSRDDWDDDEAAVSINCCGQQHCDESPLLALDDDEGYNCKKQKEHQLDYTARRSKKKRKSGIAWLATMDLEYHDQNDDDDDPEPSPDNRFNDNNNAMSHLESSPLRNSGRLSRRRLSAASSVVSTVTGNGPMSEAEQEERRRKIQTIMLDSTLSQMEKSKSIQSLMDGRAAVEGGGTRINRRGSTSSFTSTCSASSYACSMAQAAALAADYYADDHSVTRQGYADNHTSDNPTPGMMDIATFTNLNLGGGGGDASDLNDAPTPSSPLIHASPSSRAEYYRRGDELSVASTVSSYNCDDDDQDEADGNICPRQQFAAAKSTTEASGPVGSYRQYHGRSRSLQDWTDTDRQISATQTTVLCNPVQVSRLMEQSRPACEHYKRNCTIISPCCALAFGCRICHDDCPILPPPVQNLRRLSATHVTPTAASAASVSGAIGGKVSGVPLLATGHKNKVERRRSMPVDLGGEDEEEHHLIDRFSIREVICRGCYIRQSSKT